MNVTEIFLWDYIFSYLNIFFHTLCYVNFKEGICNLVTLLKGSDDAV
jgi:hypothetical protein